VIFPGEMAYGTARWHPEWAKICSLLHEIPNQGTGCWLRLQELVSHPAQSHSTICGDSRNCLLAKNQAELSLKCPTA